MQIYLVGGAVRDALLGLPVLDSDWVVVGATPDEMVAQGFVPVGKDFPVFLHPTTHEEYALARTERKTAPGYHGFAIHAAADVTLEEDLARRDLTINSIAAQADCTWATGQFNIKNAKMLAGWQASGHLVDPFGGQRDLANKVLRHVSAAFSEDPVRILRLARLAARFPDFSVAPQTLQLMRDMVASGEVDHLVPERVWQELAKGLMQATPSRMFEVLRDCGALARILPEVNALWGVPQRADYHPEIDTGAHLLLVLDMAARLGAALAVRLACLTHDLGKGTTPLDILPRHLGHEQRSAQLLKGLAQRLRLPTDCRELADVTAREHGNIHRSGDFDAAALMRLLERCDALRKPQRFGQILLACECDARGRLGLAEAPYPQRPRLLAALTAAQSVDTEIIANKAMATGVSGQKIGELIHLARVQAVKASLP
ncbi:MAG: multifunctional CCA addition/repair protein [Gammaproteobacteria bacterium]|uniref:multifunctional CCA addition/repair protein n=1 Tax=Rhodoferax sp. TaxID=50421 RepID=UPI0017F14A32|nr:multifunctional CCA addition/repair protein [Rhodoferax sp.]MBU3900343.1 multifunctional CCA addition/repair protein [Gammaproteobacteria bacterium]MBA3058469.1 multifunctional CCA addition/repair protein [Rhodoferax sp.]MBU3998018.1 multifunctional CCA addition/repair protein [Gammaproteobacteria bacterium]MBU4018930.1 multifunctional CCA addition/repair protein [Gammaproteobacteria bacterium]MBU4080920.1 multifunctional CCA addition/repair protein [Gammaproteobacteria bacterium]